MYMYVNFLMEQMLVFLLKSYFNKLFIILRGVSIQKCKFLFTRIGQERIYRVNQGSGVFVYSYKAPIVF